MPQIQAALQHYLAEILEEDRRHYIEAKPHRPVYVLSVPDDEMTSLEADLEIVDHLLDDSQENLASRDTRSVVDIAADLADRFGIPVERHRELALGLLQMEHKRYQVAKKRLLEGPEATVVQLGTPHSIPATTSGTLFSAGWDKYVALKSKGDDAWAQQTLRQNRATARLFLGHCGDRDVGAYGRADFARFFAFLGSLPADWAKAKRWRGMTPEDIADKRRPEEIVLTTKTIERHQAALTGFFSYLIDSGLYEKANPATGHEVSTRGSASVARQGWEGDGLRKLFASPLFTGCESKRSRWRPGSNVYRDAYYWLPILSLYHGNRLEEFAQLLKGDIREEGGISYFDINDEGSKQVKNKQSKRRLPIHPKVIELGFLSLVEAIATDDEPLFPELEPGGADNKRGHSFTKWFSRYRRNIGVYAKGLDYHSFRHGVTQKLFDAGVPELVVDEITGHVGGGTSRKVYKRQGLPLASLLDALRKVEWPDFLLGQPG